MTTFGKSMKSVMNIPTFITVLVVAIIIALLPQSPLPVSASSDDSETNAEQILQQKNLGSGDSDNFNCDENMITSASGVDCIPSGPAAPTPPPPSTLFTIAGIASGTIACPGAGEGPSPADIRISVTEEESGTVTGSVIFVLEGGTLTLDATGGTTDGNTFTVSGPNGVCVGVFTVSGDCGNDVMISYEDTDGIGTYTGDVECTLI
jgi:hypothetical protein